MSKALLSYARAVIIPQSLKNMAEDANINLYYDQPKLAWTFLVIAANMSLLCVPIIFFHGISNILYLRIRQD